LLHLWAELRSIPQRALGLLSCCMDEHPLRLQYQDSRTILLLAPLFIHLQSSQV
jgi:hypothetical protein